MGAKVCWRRRLWGRFRGFVHKCYRNSARIDLCRDFYTLLARSRAERAEQEERTRAADPVLWTAQYLETPGDSRITVETRKLQPRRYRGSLHLNCGACLIARARLSPV